MKSRKWIGTVLITLIVVVVLSAGGYALYRYGYARGRAAASVAMPHFQSMPFMDDHMEGFPGRGFGAHGFEGMPEAFQEHMEQFGHMDRYDGRYPFERGYTPYRGHMSDGYPFRVGFSPFSAFLKLLFLGFIAWLIYKVVRLFSGERSWQLSFTSTPEPEEEKPKPKGRTKKA